jgi:hypothetical protein
VQLLQAWSRVPGWLGQNLAEERLGELCSAFVFRALMLGLIEWVNSRPLENCRLWLGDGFLDAISGAFVKVTHALCNRKKTFALVRKVEHAGRASKPCDLSHVRPKAVLSLCQ